MIQQVGFPYTSTNVGAVNCQRATVNATTCTAGRGDYYQYNTFTQRTSSTFSNQNVWQVKLGVRYRF